MSGGSSTSIHLKQPLHAKHDRLLRRKSSGLLFPAWGDFVRAVEQCMLPDFGFIHDWKVCRWSAIGRDVIDPQTQPETYSATQPERLGASSRLPLLQIQKRLTQPFGRATSPHWGIVWNSPVDGCVSTSSVLISAIPKISIVDDSRLLLKTSRN